MSSMIHGIRILAKDGCKLTFKTFLIYSDWNSLPKTYDFPVLFLGDYTDFWEYGKSNFDKDFANQKDDIYNDQGNVILAQRYVKSLKVSEFKNFPIKPEFLESTWHYYDKSTEKFHNEEFLPNAIYELEVTDPKWIDHVPVGAVWETTACELTGPYWHLETPGKDGKFYTIYRSMDGPWYYANGKKGTKGSSKRFGFQTFHGAKIKVKEKLRKEYKIIFQNFETDWEIEKQLVAEAKKEKLKAESEVDSDAFFNALIKKDYGKIEEMLSGNVDPNTIKDEYGNYALQNVATSFSFNEDKFKLVKLLLEKGADPNQGNYGAFLPSVFYSNRTNEWKDKSNQLLLDNGADITLIGGSDNHSVLQTAAVSGRKELLKKCIDAGMDVMHRSKQGHTALHYAAQNKIDSIDIIDLLLDNGADINDNNGSWGTPLHFAASGGNQEIVNYLIKKGAKTDLVDTNRNLPIHEVMQYGEIGALKAFLLKEVDLNLENNAGLKPIDLLMARVFGNKNNIEKLMLLSEYQDITKLDSNKLCTQLLKESKKKTKLTKGEEEVLIDLIGLGFNPFWQDQKGTNIFQFAAKTGSLKITQACLDFPNQEVNLQDEFGWTALHYAKATKNKEIVDLILKSSKKIDQKLASKKQRKVSGTMYPKGTTAESIKM